ncbi:amidohydrolase [[Clostridium] symbiosum]|uniref:amidohydrolase n=1 Tax=Clostridium symbiosum TaxID=1512 RepID=UPI001D08994D|nr:amidohydrolase [[Clostridium] symbiosum]MCB6608280.1 amidohydrolase [[Clostridium] symbiosum]MCB6932830.1 amidohydrolase [[Clostridium] symbiosum]
MSVLADLVFMNGKIAKVDTDFNFCTAIAVKDGWIIDTGSDEEIKCHIGKGTEVIDLKGKLMLPGAQDCHTHACLAGLYKMPWFLDVGEEHVSCLDDIKKILRDAAEKTPKGQWIMGSGLSSGCIRECAEEHRQITRWDIDEAVPDHPVWLANSGLHHILVNTRALELVGITKDTPELKRHEGKIQRREDGEPTGYLDDFMLMDAVGKVSTLLSDEQIRDCIILLQREMNENGVTTHTDMVGIGGDHLFAGAGGSRVIDVYEAMGEAGELTARVSVNIMAGLNGLSTYDAIIGGAGAGRVPELKDRNWVDACAVKLFGDSMWLRPDGRKTGGSSYFPGDTIEEQREEITRTIVELHRMGYQIGIHSTGGCGIDTIVDAYVKAMELYPGKDLRHFVIHGDDFSDENMRKCAKHHIVLSSQAVAPWGFMESLVNSVDPEDPSKMFDYQRFMDNGVVVSQGSDAPCMTVNWLMGLKFAMTRTTVSGTCYNKGNGCTIEDGIRMYTINGAYQNHRENVTGSIEVDKLADLQVLDTDIFEISPDEFDEVRVVMTVVGGRIVHSITV